MKTVSRDYPLNHYQWGEACDGWNLVEEGSLSVKLEKMPPGTAEHMHYHQRAQQFFFVLRGTAFFETEEGDFEVGAQQGMHIRPGLRHRILNKGTEALEFLLSSQPSTAGDRINTA